ncbi:unnamed protein product [Litomosoides sigmodontis]|uniref:Pyroglutamyl-peptidase I n=1 Tax=Litomosoides sigmodontis TaxID=42156 RepID=A0A3P6SJN6_LITSI|nr:unnamed protein product [Litomosoides sigmodontis]
MLATITKAGCLMKCVFHVRKSTSLPVCDDMTDLAEAEFTIILTGFGPFQLFDSNPSEKVVQRIAEEGIKDIQPNTRIIVKVMPVAYDDVHCIVSELWEIYHPDLVVHLGVHSLSHCIRIETRSCGIGYYQDDVKSKTPENHRCILSDCSAGEEENTICTGLDCVKLVEALRVEFAEECVQFELSDNPGSTDVTILNTRRLSGTCARTLTISHFNMIGTVRCSYISHLSMIFVPWNLSQKLSNKSFDYQYCRS